MVGAPAALGVVGVALIGVVVGVGVGLLHCFLLQRVFFIFLIITF
jgi:hypothetical protein